MIDLKLTVLFIVITAKSKKPRQKQSSPYDGMLVSKLLEQRDRLAKAAANQTPVTTFSATSPLTNIASGAENKFVQVIVK